MADPIIGKISVGDGATFTPSVTGDVLSWTNNKNLPNPASIDIVGATFTPSVDNSGVLSWSNNKGLPNPASVDIPQAVIDKKPGWGIPIGYEYFTFNPNIPQGALPLFGGEYSRTTYSDLWAWVQNQTGYLKTEAEWQTLSTSNNGNVPYYSDGDGSTTFRVPSLKCWVKAADGTVSEVGSYKAAGLPNITGYIGSLKIRHTNQTDNHGALYGSNYQSIAAADGTNPSFGNINIDASRSSSIYGNSTTVQPESIVGLWLVQAYGVVVDTGTVDEQQYIDDRIAALPNTFLPLAGGTLNGALGVHYSANNVDGYIKSTTWGLSMHADSPDYDDAGASLILNSKYLNSGNNANYLGDFTLSAFDGVTRKALVGKPNGTLTWSGKNVAAVDSASLNSASGYIRFTNGLQICWGLNNGNSIPQTITYPVAFNGLPCIGIQSGDYAASNWANTGFSLAVATGHTKPSTVYFRYIAVGAWG